jgi:hypothetical protein
MSNYNSVLSQLKKINDEAFISCYVPSIAREVKFKPMSVAQQQQLIKNINDGAAGNLKIINSINDLLGVNCTEDVELHVFDREVILLQYRMHDFSISKEEHNKITDAIDAIKQINDVQTEKTLDAYGITIKCKAPTLDRDTRINAATIKSIEASNSKKQQDIIPLIFTHQIIKYIADINISEDATVSFANISDLPNLITIIDNIPVDLNNGVLTFANNTQTVFAHVFEHKNIALQTPTL